jgi:hypothetical protein
MFKQSEVRDRRINKLVQIIIQPIGFIDQLLLVSEIISY